MLYIVLAFLFISVLFYLVFGGADFGVGVLEFFSGKDNRVITKKTAYRIIGPVWEANHIWLIVCIVIMWIGFPNYYNVIMTQLHIPTSLMLIGIIGRGTAFVFRHYDAYKGESQKLYDRIFHISSVITPIFIGIIAGSLLSGEMIHPDKIEGKSYTDLYVYTWFNPFSILVGLFVLALTTYLSSVFLIGETEGEERGYYLNKAKRANILAFLFGGLVFAEAFISHRAFASIYADNILAIVSIIIATFLLVPLWKLLGKGEKIVSRVIVGFQMFLVLTVWSVDIFPNLIIFKEGQLSILEGTPSSAVYTSLGMALIIASIFVLPGLYHLFKTFGLLTKE